MCRTFLHPLLFPSMLLALFCGCSKSPAEDPLPPDPKQPSLTLTQEPATWYPSTGGSGTLVFTTNESWQVEFEPLPVQKSATDVKTDATELTALQEGSDTEYDSAESPWYSAAPLAGEAGNNLEIAITIDPNESFVARSVVLVLRTVADESNASKTILEERIELTQAKKNAIIVGDNLREVGSEEQTLTVEVQSNVDYTVTIREGSEWIGELPESRAAPGLEERTHRFTITANPDFQERTGIIIFTDRDSELSDELTVVQAARVDPDPERTALKALYEAGGGGGWPNQTNWCSDRPLNEWYGVETDAEGHVTALRLPRNNLSGAILKYVGKLTSLQHIDLSYNALEEDLMFFSEDTRSWRSHLDDLLDLETMDMSHNRLTDGPSITWSRMEKLQRIDLSSNRLTGTPIPIQWEPLYRNGKYIDVILNNNGLSGDINDFVVQHPQWSRIALQFIRQKMIFFEEGEEGKGGLTYEDVYLPDFTYTDLRNGKQGSMRDLYSANKLTMLLQWDPTQEGSRTFAQTVVRRFHTLYNKQGFEVVAILPEGEEFRQATERYLQTHDVAWPVVSEYADSDGKRVILPTEPYPSFMLVDQSGEVVEDMYPEKRISDPFWVYGNPPTRADLVGRPFEIIDMLNLTFDQMFGYSEYQSTDFSKDKTFETLQRATKGKGIDVVLIGEAFTDIDIETGFYKQLMEFAMESFFASEPTKSYRDYFNVHLVYAVSRDSHIGYYMDGIKTALDVRLENSYESFDVSIAMRNLPDYYRLPVATGVSVPTVGVVINNSGGGVTYMQSYGLGASNAFSGYNCSRVGLKNTFIHETVGHAFGLLGDEYDRGAGKPDDDPYRGTISESDRRKLISAQNNGWCLNVSLTSNPTQVPWSHLIGHSRFPYVGVHEGGNYYHKGVWRSEYQSVMREHRSYQYFNAACRELIVKNIMKYSGEEYSFEKFLAKDSDEGRPGKSSASALHDRSYNTNYHH